MDLAPRDLGSRVGKLDHFPFFDCFTAVSTDAEAWLVVASVDVLAGSSQDSFTKNSLSPLSL
jgi:hypothetical protein